jgi:phosphatidylglycerol:prolipoprotein diacylglycerol transferase
LGGGLVFYGGLIGASLTAFWYARKHDIEFLRLADIAMPTVSLGQALGRLGCFSAGCCWGDVAPHSYGLGVNFPGAGATNLLGGPAGTASLAYQSMATDNRFVVEATGQVMPAPAEGAVRISDWVTQHGHTLAVHPTQLYESTGQLILFIGLLTLRGFRRFHGMIFGTWLICYAMLRSTVELFRGDVERGTLHGLLNYLGLPSLAEKVPLEAWYNMSISQFISLCMFSLGATVLVRGFQTLNAQPRVDFKALAIS